MNEIVNELQMGLEVANTPIWEWLTRTANDSTEKKVEFMDPMTEQTISFSNLQDLQHYKQNIQNDMLEKHKNQLNVLKIYERMLQQ